jgi:hypothetical protein
MYVTGIDKASGAILIHTTYKDYPRGFMQTVGHRCSTGADVLVA